MSFRAHPSLNTRKDVTQQSWDQPDFPQSQIPSSPRTKACSCGFSTPQGQKWVTLPCWGLHLQYLQQLIKKMAQCALEEIKLSREDEGQQAIFYGTRH